MDAIEWMARQPALVPWGAPVPRERARPLHDRAQMLAGMLEPDEWITHEQIAQMCACTPGIARDTAAYAVEAGLLEREYRATHNASRRAYYRLPA